MRQDQYERLQALEEKLVDVVLRDAEPVNWPADGKLAKDMTQQERGDAYWGRRLAMSSIAVLVKVLNVIHGTQERGALAPLALSDDDTEGDSNLEKEIAAAEQDALRLMRRLKDRGVA